MGNVLVHFSHVKAGLQLARLAGVNERDVRKALFQSPFAMDYECGRLTTDEMIEKLQDALSVTLDTQRTIEAISDIFWPKHDMEDLLQRVKGAGRRTLLLSNTNAAHFSYIEKHYDFLRNIDEVVLSYRVGACKPERKIYEHALALAQCQPDECLFIDDVLENVDGAIAAGLPAHLFSSAGEVEKILAIREANMTKNGGRI